MQYAIVASDEAIAQAGLSMEDEDPSRVSVVFGSGIGGIDELESGFKTLFEKVLVNYDQTQRYIERFTSNWDIERIAFMDYLILATAVAELTSCPEIPVKVTLDEYIEISKYYSGPGSSVFINGVLDKLVAALTEEGKIQKTGRGLI